jgi:hypothetical protein
MTWELLGPKGQTRGAAVTVSTSEGKGRLPPFLAITLRRPLLPEIELLKPRGGCRVLFGRGPNAGQLRIEAGEVSMLRPMGRKTNQGETLLLTVKLPEGIKAVKRGPEPVEWQLDGNALTVKLPTWAVAVERVTVPAGRTSIMDRVPDPAASLRGARA